MDEKVTKGKELMDRVLKAMDMNLEEFLVNALANSAEFSNIWAHEWKTRMSEWTPEMRDELNRTDGCVEDLIAISLIHKGITVDTDDGEKEIMPDDVYRGMTILESEYPYSFSQYAEDCSDAYTDDAFLQCMVFGELIYG